MRCNPGTLCAARTQKIQRCPLAFRQRSWHTSVCAILRDHDSAERSKGLEMEISDNLRQLGAELLEVNRRLFERSHLDAAYHALAAALHCAGDCGDISMVSSIVDAANSEHDRVAQRVLPAPLWEIRHDAAATQRTTLERLYAAIERQARARLAVLELQQRMQMPLVRVPND